MSVVATLEDDVPQNFYLDNYFDKYIDGFCSSRKSLAETDVQECSKFYDLGGFGRLLVLRLDWIVSNESSWTVWSFEFCNASVYICR